jgi:hypothetical protein
VEVSIVQLSDSAGGTGAKEVGHEVDILTSEVSVVREMALVEGGLEGLIVGVT